MLRLSAKGNFIECQNGNVTGLGFCWSWAGLTCQFHFNPAFAINHWKEICVNMISKTYFLFKWKQSHMLISLIKSDARSTRVYLFCQQLKKNETNVRLWNKPKMKHINCSKENNKSNALLFKLLTKWQRRRGSWQRFWQLFQLFCMLW